MEVGSLGSVGDGYFTGNLLHSSGTSPFSREKSTISMGHVQYLCNKLPEATSLAVHHQRFRLGCFGGNILSASGDCFRKTGARYLVHPENPQNRVCPKKWKMVCQDSVVHHDLPQIHCHMISMILDNWQYTIVYPISGKPESAWGHVVSWRCWICFGVQGSRANVTTSHHVGQNCPWTWLEQVQVGPGCSDIPYWPGTHSALPFQWRHSDDGWWWPC